MEISISREVVAELRATNCTNNTNQTGKLFGVFVLLKAMM